MHPCLFQSGFAHFILGSIFADLFLIKVHNVHCLLSLTWAVSSLQSPVLFLKSCPCFCSLIMSSLGSSATSAICLEDPPPSSFLVIVLCLLCPWLSVFCASRMKLPWDKHQLSFCLYAEDLSLLLCTHLSSVWARNTCLAFQHGLVDMEMSADIFLSLWLFFFPLFQTVTSNSKFLIICTTLSSFLPHRFLIKKIFNSGFSMVIVTTLYLKLAKFFYIHLLCILLYC